LAETGFYPTAASSLAASFSLLADGDAGRGGAGGHLLLLSPSSLSSSIAELLS
ncbi:hypothetical protein U1Q18_005059, partial [Sarracenia purpurea var. burkii]